MPLSNSQMKDLLADRPIKAPRKRGNPESELQRECVAWWEANAMRLFNVDPRLLYAVPNGAVFGYGAQRVIRARILLLEGMRPGWPDIGIDVARHGWHGLRIEMKLPSTMPSPRQREIHALLKAQGYCVIVCRSVEEFVAGVVGYLNNLVRQPVQPQRQPE